MNKENQKSNRWSLSLSPSNSCSKTLVALLLGEAMLDKIQQMSKSHGGSLQHQHDNHNKKNMINKSPCFYKMKGDVGLVSSQCLVEQATSLLWSVTKFHSQIVIRVDLGSLQKKYVKLLLACSAKHIHLMHLYLPIHKCEWNLVWPTFTNLKNHCRDLSQIVQNTCHCTEIYFNDMSNNTVMIQKVSKIIIHFYGFAPKGYL